MPSEQTSFLISPIEQHRHAGDDDLLTAGLGAAGLRDPAPPAFADAEHPTPVELRRRAIWSNWRGIADLAPGGGYGELYGYLQPVPGREYHAFAKLPGAQQPHRVMAQVPDNFDVGKRCILVTASPGSRGIYGGISLAGSWGLTHGCAVAYTDKGGGTGFVDAATGYGVKLDGTRANNDEDIVEFNAPRADAADPSMVAVKQAHSGDNPEADWGRHVRQAAEFALQVLDAAHPESAPFTFANTRLIAVGLSNGGGAVLRAAELPGDWLDGVVAVSPNIHPAEGSRSVYDYGMEAALYMPCALNASAYDDVEMARPGGGKSAAGVARCVSLQATGLLQPGSPEQGADEARAILLGNGWTDGAIRGGALATALDLWRAVAVTYASAYARTPATDMPCGYSIRAIDAKGVARAPTLAEKAAWWGDATGIPAGVGIGVQEALTAGPDPGFPGLLCLRALSEQSGGLADVVQRSVAATRAGLPRDGLPVLVMHGADDGLVPEAFSGAAYARWAMAAGRDVRYWRVVNAQHFDNFLCLPAMASRYVPMLPYAYHGLDAMWAHLDAGQPLPGDAEILTTTRRRDGAALAPLSAGNLGKFP
jgi:hydroxybutyrate-dimer hydrolase